MSDLIDRQQALHALVTIDTTRYCVPCKEVLKAIRELPSVKPQIIACSEDEVTDMSNCLGTLWRLAYERGKADAEPQIIRCENCKHYKEWESEFTPNAVVTQCMADNFPICKAIPDGWFCAGAERRTDG